MGKKTQVAELNHTAPQNTTLESGFLGLKPCLALITWETLNKLISFFIVHPVIPIAKMVKNLPAMQVRSLGQEDPLEKEMVIHSSILAWRIPRTEEPGGLQSMGSQRVGHG